MKDRLGWIKKLLSDEWYNVCLSTPPYQGWEIETDSKFPQKSPAFVKLAHVRGKKGTEVESNTLCVKWDDVAQVGFYQRDWTEDGIPFVRAGDTYWSGWWFQNIAERDRFVEWLKTQPGWTARVE